MLRTAGKGAKIAAKEAPKAIKGVEKAGSKAVKKAAPKAVTKADDVIKAARKAVIKKGETVKGVAVKSGKKIETAVKKKVSEPKSKVGNVYKEEKIKKGSTHIELKYKKSWSDAQRAEADAKMKALSEAKTVKTSVKRGGTAASSRYKSAYGNKAIPKGYDIDHTIDLQLGGKDDIRNMNPLDKSVNRSLGVQIRNKIKDYPIGTEFDNFKIGD